VRVDVCMCVCTRQVLDSIVLQKNLDSRLKKPKVDDPKPNNVNPKI
jgi:hypothetical protein